MGIVPSALGELGKLAAANPSIPVVGAGLGVGVASVGLSEAASNLTNQHALKHKEKSRDVIDAEKAAAQAKLDAMRASAKDVEIRRQAHDMWRHEPRGPTKYNLLQKEQREREKYEEMMRNRPPQSPEDKKRKKKDEKVDPADFRQRGAPKTKPKPPTPPDNKAFEEAMTLRGSIYPAPTIREKTATAFHREGSAGPSTAAPSTGAPKTGVSSNGNPSRGGSRPHSRRPGESLDVSDEVDDLIADLERSDITKETGGGRKNDEREYRRRSTVLDEKPNLDWLAVELEVFGKEMHTEEMGKIRNTKAKPIGQSRREKAREERSKLAASKLPEDLLPY